MNESLHIKTYFASSVQAALALARRELGPEAMLLNTRPSPAEARHLGKYEAVFAAPPSEESAEPQTATVQIPGTVVPSMDETLAARLREQDPAALPGYMESLITAEPVLADSHNNQEIAALIGPPGRGKTTTLVKLAVTHGLVKRKPVRLFSADYLRSGAAQQLRTLAAILGVTFESFSSPAALDHALRQQTAGLTLIDTPGFGPRDQDAAAALARCFTSHRARIASHLVLRADSSPGALAATIDRFQCFRPAYLLFTGLDEAPDGGGIFSAAAYSKLPVSFLANGQSIPEDLEPASASRIVQLTLGARAKNQLVAA